MGSVKLIATVILCWILGGILVAVGLTVMNIIENMPHDGATWVANLGACSLTLAGLVVFFGFPVVLIKEL